MPTLARQPYNVGVPKSTDDFFRELQRVQRSSAGLFVPRVLVFGMDATAYAVRATDWLILCDCTAGAITLTFPLAARVDGLHVVIVKTDASANAVTLSGTFSGSVNPTVAVQFQSAAIDAGNSVYYYTAATIGGAAVKLAHALSVGTHLAIGAAFDGSAAQTITTDATSANTASTIVARDASGNFTAGTITGASATDESFIADSGATGSPQYRVHQNGNFRASFGYDNAASEAFFNRFGNATHGLSVNAADMVTLHDGLTLSGFGAGTAIVSVGAADSGGVGFRLLRVPN